MNLALTYASKTSHVRLARYISELIQQRAEEDGEEPGEEGPPDEQEDDRPAMRRERSDPGALVPSIRRQRSDSGALVPEMTQDKTRLLNVKMAEEPGGEVVGSGKVFKLMGRTSDKEGISQTGKKCLGATKG